MPAIQLSADVSSISIPTVVVGDPGNAPDPSGIHFLPGIGAVSYTYHIGAYEVTNSQYAAFLNAVAAEDDPFALYSPSMSLSPLGGIVRFGASGNYSYLATRPNAPVSFVSFWDCARFANWLTNGQGSGGTETGVYDLTDWDAVLNNTVTRNATAWANGGVAITSLNEWHKAAYYSGSPTGADGDGYWRFPTQSNNPPLAAMPNNTDPNTANFDEIIFDVTDAGSYSLATSHYGTFDQGGNLYEWNDYAAGSNRIIRGGSFLDSSADIQSNFLDLYDVDNGSGAIGFRVSSLGAIPEPSLYAAIICTLSLFAALRRRRSR